MFEERLERPYTILSPSGSAGPDKRLTSCTGALSAVMAEVIAGGIGEMIKYVRERERYLQRAPSTQRGVR